MNIKFTVNTYYKNIWYRFLSHITNGDTKKHYKYKYHTIKNIINNAQNEKFYIFGIHVASLIIYKDTKCYKIFEFPVVVICEKDNRYTMNCFGVRVYKHTRENCHFVDNEINMSNIQDITNGMTDAEKGIYHLINAVEYLEGKAK